MKALVTGAGGFVGANLVRDLLGQGHDVVAVTRPESPGWRLADVAGDIRAAELDLRDAEATRRVIGEHRPDWVFHLAAHGAYSWQRDPERIMQTNLVATVRLLAACEEHGFAAFVHAGSSSEYGFKDHPPREDELVEPNSDYAVMKAAATLHCRFVAMRQDLHVVTLRLYSVFGPWEEPGRLMPTLVARGLEGRLPPLVAPDTPRDFVSERDACRAFTTAAERADLPRGTVLNIGSGRETRLREVVEIVREELGLEAEPEWGTEPPRSWDAATWYADADAARELLGWSADEDVRAGFRRLVGWFRERRDLWPRYGVASSAPAR